MQLEDCTKGQVVWFVDCGKVATGTITYVGTAMVTVLWDTLTHSSYMLDASELFETQQEALSLLGQVVPSPTYESIGDIEETNTISITYDITPIYVIKKP